MAENNYLEIDPKSSNFSTLFDIGENIDDEAEKKFLMADPEAMIPEVGDVFDVSSNVKKFLPIPGICVKTKTDKNEKLFINLCHHSVVPPPPLSFNVEDFLKSSEESLFHFPLSLGELRVEKDKSGHKCMCYDAVINSDYYHEVLKNTKIRDFILNLAFSTLEQKYNMTIENGCLKFLKNKPYHGEVVDHFIRVEPQTNEKILPFEENMVKDDTVVPDSKLSILANLIDSNAKNSDLKKGELKVNTEVVITEVDENSKIKTGIEESCDLSDVAANVPIKPKIGLCAKTKTNKGEKIFMNLCHHNALPHPPPSMNIEDILKSPEESLLCFPLSLGELRVEKDVSGNECKCFDVVINSDYYHHEVLKKNDLCHFILILASTGIERKHNINIDAGAIKILQKRPYHGKMPGHFIRLLGKSQTSEKISSFSESMSENDIIIPVQDSSEVISLSSPKITDYSLYQKPTIGKASLLIFQCFIPDISDKRNLDVFVSKRQLTVEDKKGNTLVKVPLKYTVYPEKCLSNFWDNRLTVAMPVEGGDTD